MLQSLIVLPEAVVVVESLGVVRQRTVRIKVYGPIKGLPGSFNIRLARPEFPLSPDQSSG